jgi:sodium transport system ATP-binding protein
MLEVVGLSKSFPLAKPRRGRAASARPGPPDSREDGRWFHAVADVSFTAPAGAIVGLLGPNGAGKTTLLRVLSTALRPTAGTASFDGVDIVRDPLEVRRRLGFLSGSTGLYGRLTPRELLAYFGSLHGLEGEPLRRRIDELVALLRMGDYVDRRNDTLSTGMKQKVSIARTLVHDPSIVVFDEPTTGLDVAAAETILRLVERCRDEGKTVLLSTHHLHEVARVCDTVVIIDRGRLCFSGSVEQMRERGGAAALDRALLCIIGADQGEEGADA